MKNVPNKIHLVLGADGGVEDFKTLSEVTWCEDRINENDLCYISVSSILARIKELETEFDNSNSSFSTGGIIQRLSELENLIK